LRLETIQFHIHVFHEREAVLAKTLVVDVPEAEMLHRGKDWQEVVVNDVKKVPRQPGPGLGKESKVGRCKRGHNGVVELEAVSRGGGGELGQRWAPGESMPEIVEFSYRKKRNWPQRAG
jgi:hypothetical protein